MGWGDEVDLSTQMEGYLAVSGSALMLHKYL